MGKSLPPPPELASHIRASTHRAPPYPCTATAASSHPFTPHRPEPSSTNSSIDCTALLGEPDKYQTDISFLRDEAETELPAGKLELSIARTSNREDSITPNTQKIFVYAPPAFGNVTPSYTDYGGNATLPLVSLDPWATLDSAERTRFVTEGLGNVMLRFVTPFQSAGSETISLIRVAVEVPATVVANNETLPLDLVFFVPMPIVGGALLTNASQARLLLLALQRPPASPPVPLATSTGAACAQIHVALNGQQYANTGTFFQFNEYCGGRTLLTAPSGIFYDHPVSRQGSGPPRPYSFCQWIITVDIADISNDPAGKTLNLALQVVRACPPSTHSHRCTPATAARLPRRTATRRAVARAVARAAARAAARAVAPSCCRTTRSRAVPRPQIEPGSLLQNVGFDSLTIYNSSIKSAATLVRKWPIDIADAGVVPAAFESSSNTMLVEFQTGGYSGSADSYQGFSARCRAPLLTRLPSLQLPPHAAPRAKHALAELNCGDALFSGLLVCRSRARPRTRSQVRGHRFRLHVHAAARAFRGVRQQLGAADDHREHQLGADGGD